MAKNPVVTLYDDSGVPIGDATAGLPVKVLASTAAASTNPFPLAGSPATSQVVSATPKDYRGFTLRETAGATAVLRIWDNATTSSGTIHETIGLTANESRSEFYSGGMKSAAGIYFQVVSGSVEGSVRTG
jgi:hypothetical protein